MPRIPNHELQRMKEMPDAPAYLAASGLDYPALVAPSSPAWPTEAWA